MPKNTRCRWRRQTKIASHIIGTHFNLLNEPMNEWNLLHSSIAAKGMKTLKDKEWKPSDWFLIIFYHQTYLHINLLYFAFIMEEASPPSHPLVLYFSDSHTFMCIWFTWGILLMYRLWFSGWGPERLRFCKLPERPDAALTTYTVVKILHSDIQAWVCYLKRA